MKINLTRRKKAFEERYESQQGNCENCGQFIDTYENISSFCFAHWKTRNKFKESEYYFMFSLVCQELHVYEHQKAANLEKHLCVRKFKELYDISNGFWKDYVKKVHGIDL